MIDDTSIAHRNFLFSSLNVIDDIPIYGMSYFYAV